MTKKEAFMSRRESGNEAVLRHADLTIKRFLALDGDAYQEGVIPSKYKELLGLVASAVLRCGDCIAYHVLRAKDEGATQEEIAEALSIALIVGGSVVIPHLREAFELLEEL
jgi:ribonuclease HI